MSDNNRDEITIPRADPFYLRYPSSYFRARTFPRLHLLEPLHRRRGPMQNKRRLLNILLLARRLHGLEHVQKRRVAGRGHYSRTSCRDLYLSRVYPGLPRSQTT